jgi:glucan phosphoethanolaminetransferase (alkaline phosphatase superfamily)
VNTVFGIPTHPFLGHLVAAVIPLAALLMVLVAVIPRLPQLVRWITLALSALSVALVSVAESSGRALMRQVRTTTLDIQHARMGDDLMPWVIGLFVVCVALLVTIHRSRRRIRDRPGTPHPSATISHQVLLTVRIVLAVIALALATGTIIQTVRIGHSGAEATWSTVR